MIIGKMIVRKFKCRKAVLQWYGVIYESSMIIQLCSIWSYVLFHGFDQKEHGKVKNNLAW